MNCGVYSITSPSGNCYVGSSTRISKRWREHKAGLLRGDHHSYRFQGAHNKYGVESLVFKTLLICAPENLLMYEQAFLDYMRPRYNVLITAGSTVGIPMSKATKAKLSAALKGRVFSTDTRAKLSDALKQHVRSDAHNKKIGERLRGRALSAETKAKLSVAMAGKKHTEETKKKMSADRVGRSMFFTEAHRKNLAASRRGKSIPNETKAKISAALTGRQVSEITRAKLSAKAKERVAAGRLNALVDWHDNE